MYTLTSSFTLLSLSQSLYLYTSFAFGAKTKWVQMWWREAQQCLGTARSQEKQEESRGRKGREGEGEGAHTSLHSHVRKYSTTYGRLQRLTTAIGSILRGAHQWHNQI